MTKNEIIFEVLQATGLNWNVTKQPTFFKGNAGLDIEVPEKFATVRSDNEAVLGTVGNQYTVLNNHEMVEMVYDAGSEVFNKDLEINHPWNNAETLGSVGNLAGGSLKAGKAVFVQLELPSTFIGNSGVNRFITITNHHDGNKALGFGTANQVICCANTFAIANKELSKIRHTVSMAERVAEATKALRRILSLESEQMNLFEAATKVQFNNTHLEQVMGLLFGADKIKDPKASTKLKNQVKDFAGDLETSIVEQNQETLWTVFNAVTRFTNHSRATKDKDYSLMFGTDASLNQKAYKWLEETLA